MSKTHYSFRVRLWLVRLEDRETPGETLAALLISPLVIPLAMDWDATDLAWLTGRDANVGEDVQSAERVVTTELEINPSLFAARYSTDPYVHITSSTSSARLRSGDSSHLQSIDDWLLTWDDAVPDPTDFPIRSRGLVFQTEVSHGASSASAIEPAVRSDAFSSRIVEGIISSGGSQAVSLRPQVVARDSTPSLPAQRQTDGGSGSVAIVAHRNATRSTVHRVHSDPGSDVIDEDKTLQPQAEYFHGTHIFQVDPAIPEATMTFGGSTASSHSII